jgi:hypothetical protein
MRHVFRRGYSTPVTPSSSTTNRQSSELLGPDDGRSGGGSASAERKDWRGGIVLDRSRTEPLEADTSRYEAPSHDAPTLAMGRCARRGRRCRVPAASAVGSGRCSCLHACVRGSPADPLRSSRPPLTSLRFGCCEAPNGKSSPPTDRKRRLIAIAAEARRPPCGDVERAPPTSRKAPNQGRPGATHSGAVVHLCAAVGRATWVLSLCSGTHWCPSHL